jgi:hypothetical protein
MIRPCPGCANPLDTTRLLFRPRCPACRKRIGIDIAHSAGVAFSVAFALAVLKPLLMLPVRAAIVMIAAFAYLVVTYSRARLVELPPGFLEGAGTRERAFRVVVAIVAVLLLVAGVAFRHLPSTVP